MSRWSDDVDGQPQYDSRPPEPLSRLCCTAIGMVLALLLCACSGSDGEFFVCVNCPPKPPPEDERPEGTRPGLTVLVSSSTLPLVVAADAAEAPAAGRAGARVIPQHLSETGLFVDIATLAPHPSLIEYDINAPAWNEGARVRRWLALPASGGILFHPTEAWGFPAGTVLVQQLDLDLASGAYQRVETRVLVHADNGWQGYSYRWQNHQLDAVLSGVQGTRDFSVLDAGEPTGQRWLRWRYPSERDCFACHRHAAGVVLGVRTRQMNRDFVYQAVTDNQLRALNHIGAFDRDIGPQSRYPALPETDDQRASMGPRYPVAPAGSADVPVAVRRG